MHIRYISALIYPGFCLVTCLQAAHLIQPPHHVCPPSGPGIFQPEPFGESLKAFINEMQRGNLMQP